MAGRHFQIACDVRFIRCQNLFVNTESIHGSGCSFYSQKQNLNVYYILAELDASGASLVSDVTDDLNRLFYPLAMPLSRIMNIYK